MLRWRLILEEYGPYIKYIQGGKHILSDALSTFLINRNQDTTHDSTYKNEIVLLINYTKELPEVFFPY